MKARAALSHWRGNTESRPCAACWNFLGVKRSTFHGRKVFWEGLKRTLRDERIRAEFTGNNVAVLARRYRLSNRQVRNILAKNSPHKTGRGVP